MNVPFWYVFYHAKKIKCVLIKSFTFCIENNRNGEGKIFVPWRIIIGERILFCPCSRWWTEKEKEENMEKETIFFVDEKENGQYWAYTQCKTGDSSWQGAALVSAEAFRQPPWKPQNSCIIKNVPFEFDSNFYSKWKVWVQESLIILKKISEEFDL